MKKIFLIFLFCFLCSCTNIDFVLDKGSENLLKNNTSVVFKGESDKVLNQEITSLINNKKGEYILIITPSKERENRLVKQNQVAEKIDYKIAINYSLFFKDRSCNILNKTIITEFSFVPKSFGYNFGADRSFEELFRNSIRKNVNNFINNITDTKKCI